MLGTMFSSEGSPRMSEASSLFCLTLLPTMHTAPAMASEPSMARFLFCSLEALEKTRTDGRSRQAEPWRRDCLSCQATGVELPRACPQASVFGGYNGDDPSHFLVLYGFVDIEGYIKVSHSSITHGGGEITISFLERVALVKSLGNHKPTFSTKSPRHS